ncbi:MAG: AAA family ATPase [Phycisphaerales bacterium]|nr:AAA family ATPase [Phycisphaerales bacterium]
MKIKSLRFSGFRGARETVSLDFPPGFMVITGRNGSGKTTVCDAIEFSLTGCLRGPPDKKEKGENFADYVWWRGDPKADEEFVALTLVDDNGTQHVIHRTPTSESGTEVLTLLYDGDVALDNPVQQIARTLLLRDEEITRLSVHLKETERFDLVRAGLGTADFTLAEEKSREVQRLLKKQNESALDEYDKARELVARQTSELSELRSLAAEAQDISEAKATIRELTSFGEGEDLILATKEVVANCRYKADAFARIFRRIQELIDRRNQIASEEYLQRVKALESQTNETRGALRNAEAKLDEVRDAFQSAQDLSPESASFAMLLKHGEGLGLQKGACPLCGKRLAQHEFESHLAELKSLLQTRDARIQDLTTKVAETETHVRSLRTQEARLIAEHDSLTHASGQIEDEFAVFQQEVLGLGTELPSLSEQTLSVLRERIEESREKASRLEKALAALEVSRLVDKINDVEGGLRIASGRVELATRRLRKLSSASNLTKEALNTIRRTRGELIERRLAELEPLMIELYQRLRPHVDWHEVRYRLRGDVRRMLSFEVGGGLNPSFMFSSGQCRAAGLAFLLALHLSRKWCKLDTLVLDDPVQHIDDYRALQLVEVLSAIRRSDRQVICTVEDRSLASLLARRLRSNEADSGSVISMVYSSEQGAHVGTQRFVQPMARRVLVGA